MASPYLPTGYYPAAYIVAGYYPSNLISAAGSQGYPDAGVSYLPQPPVVVTASVSGKGISRAVSGKGISRAVSGNGITKKVTVA